MDESGLSAVGDAAVAQCSHSPLCPSLPRLVFMEDDDEVKIPDPGVKTSQVTWRTVSVLAKLLTAFSFCFPNRRASRS